MTEETYTFPRLEGGLFGLPPNFDERSFFQPQYDDGDTSQKAKDWREYDKKYGLSPQAKREQAFYKLNEWLAETEAMRGDGDSSALAKLAAVLGTTMPTGPASKHPVENHAARSRARFKARLACTAALKAGYRP
ncbi:hypothetical protein [Phyllobacterium sp. P5_D12]